MRKSRLVSMEVRVHVPLTPCSGDLSSTGRFLRGGPYGTEKVTHISVTANFPLSPACSPTWALGSHRLQHLPLRCTKRSPGTRGGNWGFGGSSGHPARMWQRGFGAGAGRGQPGCWAALRDSVVAAVWHPLSPGEQSPFCLCWSPAHPPPSPPRQ